MTLYSLQHKIILLFFIFFIINAARKSEISQNKNEDLIKNYLMEVKVQVNQDSSQSVKIWIHHTQRNYQSKCQFKRCFIGWISKIQVINKDRVTTTTNGLSSDPSQGLDFIKPVFSFSANSQDDYEIKLSSQLDQGTKDMIFLGIQQANPYKAMKKQLTKQKQDVNKKCKDYVKISNKDDSPVSCFHDQQIDQKGDIKMQQEKLKYTFQNYNLLQKDQQTQGDNSKPAIDNLQDQKTSLDDAVPNFLAFVTIKVTKLQNTYDENIIKKAASILQSLSQNDLLIAFTRQQIEARVPRTDIQDLAPEIDIQPNRGVNAQHTRLLHQQISRKNVYHKTQKMSRQILLGKQVSASLQVKCDLVYLDTRATKINCFGNMYYIFFDQTKTISMFNQWTDIDNGRKDIYDLTGSFGTNIELQFPSPFSFVKIGFHVQVSYYINIDFQSKTLSISPSKLQVQLFALAGATTNSGVYLKFSSFLKVGAAIEGTLFQIASDPRLILTFSTQSQVCADLDWQYNWVAFKGGIRLYYQIGQIKIKRWKISIVWSGVKTLVYWEFGGIGGSGTVLKQYQCL